MSGRRCRALRATFAAEVGRPAFRREQRWLKKFYRDTHSMKLGFRRIRPPMMPLIERAQLPNEEQVSTMESA